MNDIIGKIIKNLIPEEPVVIINVNNLGDDYSIRFIGKNSNRVSTKIVSQDIFEKLEVISEEGKFNFGGDPEHFKLYCEAERIKSAYQFDPLFAVNCSIVDPLPHQIEAVYKYLLPLPKIRFLLADDTGAGKTIMTGLLIKELMIRGLIERTLIITPGGLTKQWLEDEMLLKFNLPFKLVNRAIFDSDPNIFNTCNHIITSLDFVRNDDVLEVMQKSSWEMLIVDEAHKLSAFDYGNRKYVSKRYEAIFKISQNADHLLLLTATPHRGRTDTFKNLLQLLDIDIFASDNLVTERVNEIGENGVNKFFIRRLKEEMKDWQNNPLFKNRHTRTVLYELTTEEKHLYDKVTEYLTSRKEEAKKEANIHVSLALMVMQRRLTSSIYAIKKTLKKRYDTLKGLVDELKRNPDLWDQRKRFELYIDSIDDYEELDDDEKEQMENILSDPKKFKLFTTSKSIPDLINEANQVKELYDIAENLYSSEQEEQKYTKLKELLLSEGILENDEKLVIFTEHKDTLEYLDRKLTNNGYKISTIHGGKNIDERRKAQLEFATKSQILIATDAAGEGINLQFCRLLINWDIPWNPNRLEQRMGRIHRYGQKQDVLVFNLVAQNTREGNVLEKLLTKLDKIREQIGDDRVYDVISDIFEGVSLDDIINTVFNGEQNKFDETLELKLNQDNIGKKIIEQKKKLGCSTVNYEDAQRLKQHSDEKRLQPVYVKMFFENAFHSLGGKLKFIRNSIYQIEKLPDCVSKYLREEYNISFKLENLHVCFDKQVFLDYQNVLDLGFVYFINPGNPLFDATVNVIVNNFKEDALKGTILISPEDKKEYIAYLVKSQITDNRNTTREENIADEQLVFVYTGNNTELQKTSPAKFIDLYPPSKFAKSILPPDLVDSKSIVEWCYNNITTPQFKIKRDVIINDIEQRKQFLETAFNQIIFDLTAEINSMQSKLLFEGNGLNEKILKKQERINQLKVKRASRLENMDLMKQLSPKEPEIIGCAYVVPLTEIEYKEHFGMSKDDEVEEIAMKIAMKYEEDLGWYPEDVSKENNGYDIKSTSNEFVKKYIEVKGRSTSGGVMLSENEMNRLSQLGDSAWLYIVINCKSKPELFRIKNPVSNLVFEQKSKGVQYFIRQNEWEKFVNI